MRTYTEEEVKILLAEQHRNTRHDAVELFNRFIYNDPRDTPTRAVRINGVLYHPGLDPANQIMNLPQRSPLIL